MMVSGSGNETPTATADPWLRLAKGLTGEKPVSDATHPFRPHFLPMTAAWRLNQAVAPVHRAYNAYGCYLVGSSLLRPDYRDVDVRMIMADKPFDRMFGGKRGPYLWTLACVTISEHLTSVTGLLIDFQPQQMTEANGGDYPGNRHPLGKGFKDHYSAAVPGGIA